MDLPSKFQANIKIVSITKSPLGLTNVEVIINESMLPQDRGSLLLDLEDALCEYDPSIRIWHTPLGDKNTLRNLRGVGL